MISLIAPKTYKAICNNCYQEFQFKGDYNNLLLVLSDIGWITLKNENEYHHYCPECKQYSAIWRMIHD